MDCTLKVFAPMSHQLTFLEILAANITTKRNRACAHLYVTCWFCEEKKKKKKNQKNKKTKKQKNQKTNVQE